MATEIVMPKQGNSVESCIILNWKVAIGDSVSIGDVVCEAETDKSTIDVEATSDGFVLALLYNEGDEVPVMAPMMVVGSKGEIVEPSKTKVENEESIEIKEEKISQVAPQLTHTVSVSQDQIQISPRAKHTADHLGVNVQTVLPTGPKGRIVERDILQVASSRPSLSPLAKKESIDGKRVPQMGSGIGGRILSQDFTAPRASTPIEKIDDGAVVEKPIKGIRKVTAARMGESVQSTAQFTLNSFANASSIQNLRKKLKESDPSLGLNGVTINDLVMYAVIKTLPSFPYINAHYFPTVIKEYSAIHLGCAVDTPRGLLVPVIKNAQRLSLKQLSDEAKRLAYAAIDGKSNSDDLSGSTFTVTNLGSLGIESFTPVINIPEVAILGVGGIALRPVGKGGSDVSFIPHISLSLTINHMAVDGAPGAKFLQALVKNLESIDVLLAI